MVSTLDVGKRQLLGVSLLKDIGACLPVLDSRTRHRAGSSALPSAFSPRS